MIETRPVRRNWNTPLHDRVGVMLHYDASRSDKGALWWLTKDPACRVSYHVLVTDDGTPYLIAPLESRAWHAGVCKPSDPKLRYRDANSGFYGVSIAATDGDTATGPQVQGVIAVCAELAQREGWDFAAEPWRIVGHSSEAWPRGRKADPEGSDPNRPVLSVDAIRAAFTT